MLYERKRYIVTETWTIRQEDLTGRKGRNKWTLVGGSIGGLY